MYIGREKELKMLTDSYNTKHFRFMVIYGRSRIGKTSFLRDFAHKKDTLFFTAQVKNDQLNLADFSEVIHRHFDKASLGSFSDWENALSYLTSKLTDKRLLIIIEDFHNIVAEYPQIIRLLQASIDRSWRTKNVFLIITDSDASFIENNLLGYDSPLYGRITGHMVLHPLDYLDSSKFLPDYSAEDKLTAYGILGGIPSYANQFDSSVPIVDNVAARILKGSAFLKDEPQAIMMHEFRDPAVYNSILEAIACGCRRMNDISLRIHEESQKCAKYLNTLRSAGLINKINPVGDDETSKKSLYMLSDNFFRFWYRFVFKERSFLDLKEPEAAAREILESDSFKLYMEYVFKDICREYMVRKAMAGKLPFKPYAIGRWWSGSSKTKKCQDIDLLALDQDHTCAIFGSCSFDTAPFGEDALNDLMDSAHSFGRIIESHYYLFARGGFADAVKDRARKDKNIKLIGLNDLFKI